MVGSSAHPCTNLCACLLDTYVNNWTTSLSNKYNTVNSHTSTLEPKRRSENRSDLTDLLSEHRPFRLVGAKLVLPDHIIENGYLEVEEGRIVGIGEGEGSPSSKPIHVEGCTVMPGIIDLHSDGLEKFVHPRPGSDFPHDLAILEFDKVLASCGITTMFHCVALMDAEFGTRTIARSSQMIDELTELRDSLLIHSRIHARYDLPSPESLPILLEKIEAGKIHLVSLMDHTPGQGQFRDIETVIRKRHSQDPEKGRREIMARIESSRGKIREEDVQRLLYSCNEHGITVATHDDESAEKVRYGHRHGVRLNEFPVNFEAAEEARALGQLICLGAPNALRGLSHSGNLSVREAISRKLCDILCSDYAPMSLLHSVFLLEKLDLSPLPEAVAMVTLNAAQASGIADETGSLEIGKAADLLVVDHTTKTPRVLSTFVSGRLAYGAQLLR